MKITVSSNLDNQVIEDLIITALEGGSNYWYWIEEFPSNFPAGNEPLAVRFFDFIWNFKGKMKIYDIESDPKKPELLGTISKESVKEAFNIMAKEYSYNLGNILQDNWDANDADVLFQLAVMGKVIFG